MNLSKCDENFLKEFSRDFYQKIIDIKDINIFENMDKQEYQNNFGINAKK